MRNKSISRKYKSTDNRDKQEYSNTKRKWNKKRDRNKREKQLLKTKIVNNLYNQDKVKLKVMDKGKAIRIIIMNKKNKRMSNKMIF